MDNGVLPAAAGPSTTTQLRGSPSRVQGISRGLLLLVPGRGSVSGNRSSPLPNHTSAAGGGGGLWALWGCSCMKHRGGVQSDLPW